MSNDTTMTITGNLTGDPELRFTPNGSAVANFIVAATPRRYDSQTSQWVDGETVFMRCAAWRDLAENVSESLHRGTRVVVTGRLRSHSWETPEGDKRSSMELDVDEIGPSLRWATAKVVKVRRDQPTGQAGAGQGADPWATPQPANGARQAREPVGAGQPATAGAAPSEPPF